MRMGLLLGGLLVLVLAVAGCGEADDGDGVDSAGDPPAATASGGPEGQADPVAFAQCMRDNGIEDWPDPEPGIDPGERRNVAPPGVDPAQVEAAMEQCQQYLPNGGEPPELNPEQLAQLREFAQCMRENGVPDFPDPAAEGGPGRLPDNIDPGSPEFQAAQEACQQYLPADPDDPDESGSGG